MTLKFVTARLLSSTVVRSWMLAFVVLLYATFLHMGPSLTHCTTVVLGKPGDHTAGIMYNGWAAGRKPLAGYSTMTNYPYGEDLFQPVSIASILPTGAHFILSKVTNITCAWNSIVFMSYMSGGLAMFGLLYMLTKSTLVGLFGAYAVTFTPYHAFASHGQIAGLINAGFILSFWQFLRLLKNPTKKNAVLLGGLVGINFYIDGYFVLFGMVMLGGLWATALLLDSRATTPKQLSRRRKLRLKAMCISTAVTILFLTPLLWARHHYADRIASFLGGTRSSVQQDAQTYSAEPYMYFLPSAKSPFGGQVAPHIQRSVFNRDSDPGLLFLGLSIVGLAILACLQLSRRYSRKSLRKPKSSDLHSARLAAAIVSVFAFLTSLQPHIKIAGYPIPTPSLAIISITASWRVFGRLYMLVAIGVVVLASLGLFQLMQRWPRRRLIIFILAFFVMALELNALYKPNQKAQYDRTAAPQIYHWLSQQPDIRAIAEYPLDEPPQGKFLAEYYTYQTISNKPLLNSMLPNSPFSGLRRSISGLNDPQTLPVLRSLGIDVINVHTQEGQRAITFNDSTAAQSLFGQSSGLKHIDSYLIRPGKTASYALVMPNLQFFQLEISEDYKTTYSLGKNTSLSVIRLPSTLQTTSDTVTASLELSALQRPRNVTILQNGSVLWSGNVGINRQTIRFTASPDREITIVTEDSIEELDRLLIQLTSPQIIE